MNATSAGELEARLAAARYLADPTIALVTWLSLAMHRPLLVEGPAGVGKTDLARAVAEALGRPLLRLQCYEGLDSSKALYEWDYGKQMLYTQLLRDAVGRETANAPSIAAAAALVANSEATFFSRAFLIERPLLTALTSPTPAVLLIDEVDRADPEFEALLLEILSELQITIPELGTIKADPDSPPAFILTTNGTREMTEALHRRCLHLFLDYPKPSREVAIIEAALPGIGARLAAEVVAFASRLRAMDLRKPPAISETVDWARALLLLGHVGLSREVVTETLGVLLKHQADKAATAPEIANLLERASDREPQV